MRLSIILITTLVPTMVSTPSFATTIPGDALTDFRVDAVIGAWQDTGLWIDAGDLFALEAEGTVWVAPPFTPERGEGPESRGPGPCVDPDCLLTTIDGSTAALVGKIGSSVFVVGGAFLGTASDSGFLELAFNDSHYSDNEGFFLVSTTEVPEPSTISLLGLGLISITGARRRRREVGITR